MGEKIKFTKMHGCGNDYIYINGFVETIEDKPSFVQKVSHRNFGIGGDGVIFINPSTIADFEMEMYNADGSRSEMCGNGIRCVGKYVYDYKLTNQTKIQVESMGSIKYLELFVKNGKVDKVRVDMGEPILEAKKIPVLSEDEQVVAKKIEILQNSYEMTCVSMGNPHAVVFVEEVANLELDKIGPLFEHNSLFPNRINAEFVKVIDESNVDMRVWERGTGETLACGTGCCATCVACVLNHKTNNQITVHVLGGEIEVEWNREDNRIYMTGPAVTVFDGEIDKI